MQRQGGEGGRSEGDEYRSAEQVSAPGIAFSMHTFVGVEEVARVRLEADLGVTHRLTVCHLPGIASTMNAEGVAFMVAQVRHGKRGWLRTLWRSLRPVDTWHERHPLPSGFRARTRVTASGVLVEPWTFLVIDDTRRPVDAGERWLPQRAESDQAAWQIAQWWRIERPGIGDASWHVLARPGWRTAQPGGACALGEPLPARALTG